MILNVHKRKACQGIRGIGPMLLLCLAFPVKNHGQDTVSLKSVEITASKKELSQIGKKVEPVDSTVREQFRFSSVGEVLNFNSAVFIKSYGPGGIATTAFRGGNAEQTAVLWNGFNIQNAMMGQADLALMPSLLFENIEVEYGGSSSLWGSGAVGGGIHLNNRTAFGRGLLASASFGAGSFNMLNGSVNVLMSKQRFISSSKMYVNGSDNNFKYKDTLDKVQPVKQQKFAGYNFKGLLQEFKFLINPKQIISLHAWINSNQRRLPAFNPGAESKSYQTDEAIRLTAHWNYITTNFKSTIRGGFFNDRVNYTDSLAPVFSKSYTQTIMAENENYFSWHKHNQLNVGINFLSSSAVTTNYSSRKELSRISFLAGNKFSFLDQKLLAYISARAEYFSAGTLPVTGNVSLEYRITKEISVMLNGAKVYRQPTLNEFYWLPGGNPDLEPEEGYTSEGSLSYKKQFKTVSIFISGAAFTRKIDNWILWVPGANGNPSPLNLQQVWSRGTETTWKLHYAKNKFRTGAGIITSYVLSTIESSIQENDNTLSKQLIYTPRYTINGNLSMGYDHASLIFFHQYTGYRFTASDNSKWMLPFHVSSLRFNYKFVAKKIDMIVFAACNNLFDTDYKILAGRPMPLRNYELGITLQTKK